MKIHFYIQYSGLEWQICAENLEKAIEIFYNRAGIYINEERKLIGVVDINKIYSIDYFGNRIIYKL